MVLVSVDAKCPRLWTALAARTCTHKRTHILITTLHF
jgi:hypothetical protein